MRLDDVEPSELAREIAGERRRPAARRVDPARGQARSCACARRSSSARRGTASSARPPASTSRTRPRPGRSCCCPSIPTRRLRRCARGSASAAGRDVGVLVTDSFGRPWRQGTTDVAIGAAGIEVMRELTRRARPDRLRAEGDGDRRRGRARRRGAARRREARPRPRLDHPRSRHARRRAARPTSRSRPSSISSVRVGAMAEDAIATANALLREKGYVERDLAVHAGPARQGAPEGQQDHQPVQRRRGARAARRPRARADCGRARPQADPAGRPARAALTLEGGQPERERGVAASTVPPWSAAMRAAASMPSDSRAPGDTVAPRRTPRA